MNSFIQKKICYIHVSDFLQKSLTDNCFFIFIFAGEEVKFLALIFVELHIRFCGALIELVIFSVLYWSLNLHLQWSKKSKVTKIYLWQCLSENINNKWIKKPLLKIYVMAMTISWGQTSKNWNKLGLLFSSKQQQNTS